MSVTNRVGSETRFVLLSMPRTGSTTLARVLNFHEDIRCLIEPFHPHRYDGKFHAFAVRRSMREAMAVIWERWNAIKHVWDLEGFPFKDRPELNDDVTHDARCKVIFLIRRNILQRIVSHHLSRQTHTWVGPRDAFIDRLHLTEVAPLDPTAVRRQIEAEQEAIAAKVQFLKNSQIEHATVEYEALFSTATSIEAKRSRINEILSFLGFPPVTSALFAKEWSGNLDPVKHRWATADVYRRIPDIDRLEEAVGSDATGWLFR